MTEPEGADVIVVGGGIIGAAVALRLAEAGRRVTVADVREPLGSGTGASGAMLGVLGEITPQDAPADLALRVAAWRRYPDWAGSVGHTPRTGTFIIAGRGRARDLDALRAIREAAERHRLGAQPVHPGDIPGLATAPDHRPESALFLPDEAWVDGPQLRSAVLGAALRTGSVTWADDRIESVVHRRDTVVGVKTSQGSELAADHVVLCTGAHVPNVLRDSGLPETLVPRLVPSKGTGLLLTTEEGGRGHRHVLRTPNRQFGCGLHLVPRDAGSVYLGSTNVVGRQLPGSRGQATAGEVNRLLTSAIEELCAPLSEWSLAAAVYGYRPLPMDGLPIAGRTALAGLSVATGTYRNGVLLAPLLAEAVRAGLDGDPSPAPVDISPRRQAAPADPEAVLRGGLAELVDHWRHDSGARWPELLGPLVDRLAGLAFGAGREDDHTIASTAAYLRDHGRPEMVPQAVLNLLSADHPGTEVAEIAEIAEHRIPGPPRRGSHDIVS